MTATQMLGLPARLPGWTVLGARVDSDRLVVTVASEDRPSGCDTCGAITQELMRQGVRASNLVDAPIAGLRTTLAVRRRRFRCRTCQAMSSQPMPLAMDDARITLRCRDHVVEQAELLPAATIAQQVGLHRDAVARILASAGIETATGRPRLRPERLGHCSFCLGAFRQGDAAEFHHLSTVDHHSRFGPVPSISRVALCASCHRQGAMGWLAANDG